MTGEIESLGRIRVRGLLLLAAVFVAGAVAGAAGDRLLHTRREPPPPWAHESRGLPPHLERLGLSDAQRTEIQKILDRARPTSDSLLQVTMPQVRALMGATHAAIRDVLTPQQRARFDEDLKRHERGGPRGHHGPPPFGPPGFRGRPGPPPDGLPPPPSGADSSDGSR